ncbi:hypothetical protein [Azorhizobium doebereinerae]|uniref:hypothetical protein n=1 Tax=Azorhizobium doebereinerae TaxID=281091 RepID=UPI0003F972A4|nr:hypothetical protein [Azorhizobium doebereinerae]
MEKLVRLLRDPPSHVKTLMLRTGVGAALSLGTLALAHMMPPDTLSRPVKTIAAADAPAFDFGPQKTADGAKTDAAKADVAKTDALKTATDAKDSAKDGASRDGTQMASVLPAAPLPAARPRAVPAAKLADASALPSGVERFDRCRSACDSRDPALTGAALAMSVVATGPAMPVPPPAPEATPKGPFRSAMGVIGDGRRMLDGAIGTASATLVTVKEAMLGAITPEY